MGPALQVGIAGGLTIIGAIARGDAPSPRIFVGVAVAGAGVLGLAQLAPDAARSLATVILLTALLTSGYDVARGVGSALNRKDQPQ